MGGPPTLIVRLYWVGLLGVVIASFFVPPKAAEIMLYAYVPLLLLWVFWYRKRTTKFR